MSDAVAKPCRSWCFTINNPTRINLFPDGIPDTFKYLVYQLERGEQGTPHLQGYFQLARQQRMSWIKKLSAIDAEGNTFLCFDRAALFAAKGNAEQNKAYCTKTDGRLDGPWELGAISKQGDRTDLKEAAVTLMKSGDIRDIDPSIFLKYASGCLKLAALAQPPRRDNLKVISIIGPTGIGKSYAIHDLFPDVFVVNMGNSGLWWDGYTGQQAVLFEEFKGQVQLQKMLQILDPYPLRLEIKGGLVPARFTVVFITSNSTPDQWYKNDGTRDAELQALNRRLDAGNPTAIPVIPPGDRYINVDNRETLHQRLQILHVAGMFNSPARTRTPPISESDDDEPPRLRRAVANIMVSDSMDM